MALTRWRFIAEMPCPLCQCSDTAAYHCDRARPYRQCRRCRLVFVPPDYHLGPDAEKAHYDNHRNIVDDPGYRMFLQRLAQPLIEQLAPASRGLDFGCGPGPALADILQQAGFSVQLYDLYYYPDNSVLDSSMILLPPPKSLSTWRSPGRALQMLWQLLQPGGTLGLMTKQVIDRRRFANWHYIRDPTHIAFYSRDTLLWLAERARRRA